MCRVVCQRRRRRLLCLSVELSKSLRSDNQQSNDSDNDNDSSGGKKTDRPTGTVTVTVIRKTTELIDNARNVIICFVDSFAKEQVSDRGALYIACTASTLLSVILETIACY